MHDYVALFRKTWTNIGFQKYFRNISWMLGSRIATMTISFIATIYIARNLGPTNYGELSYAVSLVGLFGFIASLGIDGILYRDLIRYPEQKLKLLGTAFYIKAFSGIIAATLCVLFTVFLSTNDVSKILIFILSGTYILNSFQIIVFDFQSRAESKYLSIISIGVSLFLNILKILVIAFGQGVIYLALILLLESILYAALYVALYKVKTKDTLSSWTFDYSYAKSLLKDSFPIILLSAFSMIYARIDQIFIKHMIDATAVGLYDSAVRISEVWSFIPATIITALYPAIVNAKAMSEHVYNKRLGKLALVLFILSILIAIPVSIFASLIIHILYGKAFAGSVIILRIYIWAGIGTSLGILVSQYLVTENYRKILSFVAFIPMVCNVILNILWIPAHGITGAAYATLVSYSLIPLSLLFFKQTRSRLFAIYKSL